MDAVTRNKIKFVIDDKDDKEKKNDISNDWVNLKDYIDADQLETDYGGSFNYAYQIEPYWKSLLEKTGNPHKIIEYN